MTPLDIILQHKALVAFFALSCVAALAFATQSDRLSDDWTNGFEFSVSPMTALAGCLVIVVLGALLGSGVSIGRPGT